MFEVEVAVLGAGFAGVGAGIQLTRRGTTSFVILEAGDDVGGTWRDNSYPGVECDVPSHLYSFSFAPNPHWSKTYGTGDEIQAYIRHCAEEHGLLDRIRFGSAAVRAEWHETRWVVTTANGDEIGCRFLISGLGGLHTPNFPDIPGLATFDGPMFHTSRWQHDVDLHERQVGIVGTGATAVQVAPKVAEIAHSLHLFQRSPVWVAPKRDEEYSAEEKLRFMSSPEALHAHRMELWQKWEDTGVQAFTPGSRLNLAFEAAARRNIWDNVLDPSVAEKLTPDFNVTCKRPTYSNTYYPMFNRPNVSLVTEGIDRVVPQGIVTTRGLVQLDALILATGFKPFDITQQVEIVGLDGLSLSEAWSDRIASYRSVMVHRFPNMFILLGPNSAGLTSAIEMIEGGIDFALRTMEHVDRSRVTGVHPTSKQVDDFTREVDELTAATTVNQGCSSWWSAGGQNHALWPSSSVRYRQMLEEANLDGDVLTPIPA